MLKGISNAEWIILRTIKKKEKKKRRKEVTE